jgi:hypothetical protein
MPTLEVSKTRLQGLASLKAYFQFDFAIPGVTELIDNSGNSHNLTDIGDPAEDASGKFGDAVALDGNDAYSITDHADLKPTGNFTIGAWFKTSTTGVQQTIFASYSENPNVKGVMLYIDANNHLTCVVGYSSNYYYFTGATVVTDGNWHFGVLTWNGATLKIFLDGYEEVRLAATSAPAYDATNYVRVGCRNYTGTNILFFTGSLDDVFLLNGEALHADEIRKIYEGTISVGEIIPKRGNLIAYYPLNGNAKDCSGNNNHGVASNITYPDSKFGKGALFNGSSGKIAITSVNLANSTFSFLCWFKKTTAGTTLAQLLAACGSGVAGQDLWITLAGLDATHIRWSYYADDLDFSCPNDTNWHCILVSHNVTSNLQRVFLDGKLLGSRTSTGDPNPAANSTHLGMLPYNNSGWLNATLDQVMIFNTEFTEAEFRKYYNYAKGSYMPQIK